MTEDFEQGGNADLLVLLNMGAESANKGAD